jgi:type I restriction enzyme S subunit
MTELPKGWSIAAIDQIADIGPRHPRDLEDSLPVTFVRMPALSETDLNFKSTEERLLGQVRRGFTHFAEGDVLFAKITPYMENGKAAVASHLSNGLGCGTTELHVLRPLGGINPKYIYYFIHRDSFREEAARNFTGTAGQLRVPVSFVRDVPIAIPPQNEQRRIVAKLEKLLSHVDAAQVRLATIAHILKRFRQSVLAAACSGRLTVDWREENKVDTESWPTLFFKDAASLKLGKMLDKAKNMTRESHSRSTCNRRPSTTLH